MSDCYVEFLPSLITIFTFETASMWAIARVAVEPLLAVHFIVHFSQFICSEKRHKTAQTDAREQSRTYQKTCTIMSACKLCLHHPLLHYCCCVPGHVFPQVLRHCFEIVCSFKMIWQLFFESAADVLVLSSEQH